MTSATVTAGTRRRASATLAALTACLAAGAFATARAAPVSADPFVTVSYHDLNIATDQGSQVLYARIVSAARQVCAADDVRDLRAVAAAADCRARAVAQAVRAVNSPALAAVHAAALQRHG
ncbi:MAG TPA: UrcA family protein [Steroidobacteraceae bacterium]|nr:UrcA family protein [Steroidobacteraceae bacterium]